ncbi:MAG: roadblock/LC7 domain-containing protein [Pseudanabaenaceae cyanobacterium SKYGB_i_bin29]|nr:roadblock/LC7 domain-containing protein [Pseudanabaenaceae cyanobacterium SKYG29]MDW8421675.1 roadblock/LC7 domain-containing protein [Pseudanabaenaceae cyanobacterium SKYGB_i_bin29]
MIDLNKIENTLARFCSNTSNVQGVALVSLDGLTIAAHLPRGMDDERVSAMSAAMLSLSERIGRELQRGKVERILVEGENGFGILTSCTQESVLLVLTDQQARLGLINLELRAIVPELQKYIGVTSAVAV